VHDEQHPRGANKQKLDEHDVGFSLFLGATVGSFACLLLCLSNHKKVTLSPGCEDGARYKKNVQ